MSITFTTENISWLQALTEQAIEKTPDNIKKAKLENIVSKLSTLDVSKIDSNVSSKQLEDVTVVLKELEKITTEYYNLSDIKNLAEYDKIKKQMTAQLGALSTYKDIFLDEANYLKEVFKDEIKTTLTKEIELEDKVSFTRADKLVVADKRYTILRDKVNTIVRVANKIRTKYDFYLKLWDKVQQSCSTATKETHAYKYGSH